jgi:hypothetical protein
MNLNLYKDVFRIAFVMMTFLMLRNAAQPFFPETLYISYQMLRDLRLPLLYAMVILISRQFNTLRISHYVILIFVVIEFFLLLASLMDVDTYKALLSWFWNEREVTSWKVADNRFSGVFALPFSAGIFYAVSTLYFIMAPINLMIRIILVAMLLAMGYATDSATYLYGLPLLITMVAIAGCPKNIRIFGFTVFLCLSPLFVSVFYHQIFAGRFTDGSYILYFILNILRVDHFLFGVFDISSDVRFLFDSGVLTRLSTGGILYLLFYYYIVYIILTRAIPIKRRSVPVFLFVLACELGGSAVSQPVLLVLFGFLIPLFSPIWSHWRGR